MKNLHKIFWSWMALGGLAGLAPAHAGDIVFQHQGSGETIELSNIEDVNTVQTPLAGSAKSSSPVQAGVTDLVPNSDIKKRARLVRGSPLRDSSDSEDLVGESLQSEMVEARSGDAENQKQAIADFATIGNIAGSSNQLTHVPSTDVAGRALGSSSNVPTDNGIAATPQQYRQLMLQDALSINANPALSRRYLMVDKNTYIANIKN